MGRKIKAVVFDMDGVLFDTERLCLASWLEVAHRHDIHGVENVFPLCIGRTHVDTLKIISAHYPELELEGFDREISDVIQEKLRTEGVPLLPYAGDILNALKAEGIPLALASSTRYETVCRQLKSVGFYDKFSAVVGGDLVKKGKPAPDIYLEACKRLGLDPADCAAVEDSFNGIRAAHAAGMAPVMVPDMVQPDEEIAGLAYIVCPSLQAAEKALIEMFR
ncbi:MAG: HAD family phosphatase [Ruminococcus sp.]|nr:HAD family phosphatase [Ruminococcus sp.]